MATSDRSPSSASVVAVGLRWGTRGPEFESRRPDWGTGWWTRARAHPCKAMTEDEQLGLIAGGRRRARGEDEGFYAFVWGWVVNLFEVDRRL